MAIASVYPLVSRLLFGLFGHDWPGGEGFRFLLTPASALHYVASTVIGGFFVGGMIRMASNQVLGREPRIGDLFSVVDVGLAARGRGSTGRGRSSAACSAWCRDSSPRDS